MEQSGRLVLHHISVVLLHEASTFLIIWATMRVPTSISESFEILDAVVDDVSIDMIRNKREGELVDCHYDLGMFIRNCWLYDETSVFVRYLRSLGLTWLEADSVSAFLIRLYWEYLNGDGFDENGFCERFANSVTPGYR